MNDDRAPSASTPPTSSAAPDADGQTKIVAQKTVVIPGADGLYVLQLNADARGPDRNHRRGNRCDRLADHDHALMRIRAWRRRASARGLTKSTSSRPRGIARRGCRRVAGGVLETRDQLGDDVGDGPDLVHPPDDLADRHRDGVGVVRLVHPLMRLADEDVLQRHRQRLRRIRRVPGVGPARLQQPRGLAGVDAAAHGVAGIRAQQRFLDRRHAARLAVAEVVFRRRQERRAHPDALRAKGQRRGHLPTGTDAAGRQHRRLTPKRRRRFPATAPSTRSRRCARLPRGPARRRCRRRSRHGAAHVWRCLPARPPERPPRGPGR